MSQITYKPAKSSLEFDEAKVLFQEYTDSLPFRLEFQGFEKELETIAEKYSLPEGALLLSYSEEKAIGCAGVRKLSAGIAELKRLYVKPEYRSLKVGSRLLEIALEEARKLGYEFIRLDTIAEMQSAVGLYQKAGFYEIEAYCYNPIETAIYMEKGFEIGLNDAFISS